MDNHARLRRVYWEVTAGCNLRCIHCRRIDVLNQVAPDELTTQQSLEMINDLSVMGKPVLILSGGEPLFRKDIFEIAAYAKKGGLPVALSTNGTLVTEQIAARVKESGVYYASISLDGASKETHDFFRGAGNFDRALKGFYNLKNQGIKVQVNFTVTKRNAEELPKIYDLVRSIGAHALYLFLLVPVGCGVEIADSQMLGPAEVEKWLEWIYDKEKESKFEIRAICAPQYYRVKSQRDADSDEKDQKRLGCLAGINICFISHKGDVFPCGYLPVGAGNVKDKPLSKIWRESVLFSQLRDETLLTGKCGQCKFKTTCGGCRARAYYNSASVLAEEPYCLYDPPEKVVK